MKKTLTTVFAFGMFVAAGLLIIDVANSGSAAPPINKTATIRLNIIQMLQRKIPIQPLADIPGGARTATNRDAAYFAWQEFIALNWANVPVTGKANNVGQSGARETADTSKKFGQRPAGVPGTSYPALVWESTRLGPRSSLLPQQIVVVLRPPQTDTQTAPRLHGDITRRLGMFIRA